MTGSVRAFFVPLASAPNSGATLPAISKAFPTGVVALGVFTFIFGSGLKVAIIQTSYIPLIAEPTAESVEEMASLVKLDN
ncbi:hypothetical protein D3C73_1267170 [compost metagenome]